MSAHATSTTSIRVQWNTVPQDLNIKLLAVFYVTTNQKNETILRTDVNVTENGVEIGNLGKFVNYTVWIRSVSTRGPGISSYPIYVRTLEEGEAEVCYILKFIGLFSSCFQYLIQKKTSMVRD